MEPERLRSIEETFHAALQLPHAERCRYLAEVCANDSELRVEVESLLAETGRAGDFMERPPGGLSLTTLDLVPQPSLEGRVLNHYRIGPVVGSGGMAEVYRARDTRLDRDVAIKVLHQVRFIEREQLERMYREARLLATLNHPNVAAIYGIEEADGLCGLVLELIEGETLSERIGRGAISVAEALEIGGQIAGGLHAAHAKGIIHRDLKPSNIKITPEGTVKIVDFGIAKLLRTVDDGQALTSISMHGAVIGTPAYMSPEQARGKPVDIRTDVWALGCVLYEALAGKPAFAGESPTDVIVRIATEDPDWSRIPASSEAPSVELERIIRKCMQKDPQLRYQSIREIVRDLGALHSNRRPQPRPARWQRSREEEEFVLPVGFAPSLFLLIQVGYLALYFAAMYHIDASAQILAEDYQIPEPSGLFWTMVLALCGIAVRIYLISAVGWRHPAAGRKFTLLFPALLVLDGIWAASPLLLWHRIEYGPALIGVALLAYVPFAQRTLMRTIYSRHGVRTQMTP